MFTSARARAFANTEFPAVTPSCLATGFHTATGDVTA